MAVEDRDCFGTGVPRNDRGEVTTRLRSLFRV